jgi:hypothetical protein
MRAWVLVSYHAWNDQCVHATSSARRQPLGPRVSQHKLEHFGSLLLHGAEERRTLSRPAAHRIAGHR